jgi:hypothetical protein
MITHGVLPVKKDKRNYSTRSFGATNPQYIPFSLDAFNDFPDQNADGEPQGCTWYCQNQLVQDEDKTLHDRHVIRDATLSMEGQTDGPCDVSDSLVSAIVAYELGQYFQLEEQGMDWFDSAIAIMQKTGRSLSVASPWFTSFEVPMFGVMPEVFPTVWADGVPGHNHKVYGLTIVNSQPVLIGKSWQGMNFGANGKHYWTRKAFNALMDIQGSGAFTISQYDGSVQTMQYGIIYRAKVIVRLLLRLIGLR